MKGASEKFDKENQPMVMMQPVENPAEDVQQEE